jgi:hypothetical protein
MPACVCIVREKEMKRKSKVSFPSSLKQMKEEEKKEEEVVDWWNRRKKPTQR